MRLAATLAATIAIFTSSCATHHNPDVLVRPEAYVGQAVRLCGYYESGHLRRSRDDWDWPQFVAVLDNAGDFARLRQGNMCLAGTIAYIGQGDPEDYLVCVDWCARFALVLGSRFGAINTLPLTPTNAGAQME